MAYRKFDSTASVREYFRELLNKDNTYEFPYQFTVHYYGRDNKYNEATIVSVVRNSEVSRSRSRPRLLAVDGTKVELSYCVVKELTEQALGIYRYLASAKEELKRNNLLEALKPYEGKDYAKLALKFKTGDEKEVYNSLTPKEKFWYHRFRQMKGIDPDFEHEMSFLWRDADDFNVEIPVFYSVSYSSSLAGKLKNYSKYLYFVSPSTVALEQLSDLWNHGWKPFKTCALYWRDREHSAYRYKGFLLRYEG